MGRLILLALCLMAASAAHAWEPPDRRLAEPPPVPGDSVVIGRRDVTIWRPETQGPAPIVVFSHGYGGCGTQSTFLTSALARRGYLVVAPRHADASCPSPSGLTGNDTPFHIPSVWTDATGRDRRDDIVAVLDELRRDPSFAGQIDWTKLALMGHSVGGYAVLGLAGAWPSWRLTGIKAVVALAPTCEPFLSPAAALGALTAPVMFQTGTRNYGIGSAVARRDGCFDRARPPARLIVFRRAGHFAWSDYTAESHDGIIAYTADFLDVHLRGKPAATREILYRGVAVSRAK